MTLPGIVILPVDSFRQFDQKQTAAALLFAVHITLGFESEISAFILRFLKF